MSRLFLLHALGDDASDLIFYDIRTNKFNYVPLNGGILGRTQIVEYTSSIVSAKDGNMLDKEPIMEFQF